MTEEELKNYDSTSAFEHNRKIQEIKLNELSIGDSRVKSLAIRIMNNKSESGLVRERIGESIEDMDGGWFAMSDPQKLLEERAKERYDLLKNDQKKTLQETKLVVGILII